MRCLGAIEGQECVESLSHASKNVAHASAAAPEHAAQRAVHTPRPAVGGSGIPEAEAIVISGR